MGGSYPERITGRYGGTRETLRRIARDCGADPGESALDTAVVAQLAGAGRVRPPRPGALDLPVLIRS